MINISLWNMKVSLFVSSYHWFLIDFVNVLTVVFEKFTKSENLAIVTKSTTENVFCFIHFYQNCQTRVFFTSVIKLPLSLARNVNIRLLFNHQWNMGSYTFYSMVWGYVPNEFGIMWAKKATLIMNVVYSWRRVLRFSFNTCFRSSISFVFSPSLDLC